MFFNRKKKFEQIVSDYDKKIEDYDKKIEELNEKYESELSSVQEKMDEAVENAVIKERQWLNEKEALRDTVDAGLDMSYSPYDHAYVYELEAQGQISDSVVRNNFLTRVGDKVKKSSKALLESVGWVLLGTSTPEDAERAQQLQELQDTQDAAFNKYYSDPIMKSIVNNHVTYVIGKGLQFEAINPKVQEELKDFWDFNDLNKKQKEIARVRFREGEYFIVYFCDKVKGKIKIRKVRSKEVTEIETHNEDIETILTYKREFVTGKLKKFDKFYRDIDYDVQLKDEQLSGKSENRF